MSSVGKCVVACAVVAFATAAGAQQGACKQDVDKLCKDVKPGEGAILQCLKTNEASLSPKCAGQMKQVQQQVKQLSAACEPDVERFCFNTPIGKGGIASCLKKHSSDLSADCKTAVSKAKASKAAK